MKSLWERTPRRDCARAGMRGVVVAAIVAASLIGAALLGII